jgi:hypothetical protein
MALNLSGYKTYLVAAAGATYYILGWASGHTDATTAVNGVLALSIVSTLRSALELYFGPIVDILIDAGIKLLENAASVEDQATKAKLLKLKVSRTSKK